jgi:hypothetical protein
VGSVDATGAYTAGTTSGTATVRATSGGVSGAAGVTVTNAAPTVATPAAANPSPVTGTTTGLSVLGADDNFEANLTYTWTVVAKPAGATDPTFSATGTNGASSTTATFAKAGAYTLRVTISDGSQTTTSDVAVDVIQTATTISVSPGTASLNLNASQAFAATAYDQFGDVLDAQPTFAWTVDGGGVGSIDPSSGLYTTPAALGGNATVRANGASISGTAAVVVTDAAPTIAVPASATWQGATGTIAELSVRGDDDGGGAALTYTWSVAARGAGAGAPVFARNGDNAAADTTASFDKAGYYVFSVVVTDAAGHTAESSVGVMVEQVATTVRLSPDGVTLRARETQWFSAIVVDQFGAPLVNQPPLHWSVDAGGAGTINRFGLYQALPGNVAATATVRGTTPTGLSGTATVAIPATTPEVPTGVTASAVGASSILVRWQRTTDADAYVVERSTDGVTWRMIVAVDGGVTTLRDERLAPATTYSYRVIAVRGADQSAPSEVATAVTSIEPAPRPDGDGDPSPGPAPVPPTGPAETSLAAMAAVEAAAATPAAATTRTTTGRARRTAPAEGAAPTTPVAAAAAPTTAAERPTDSRAMTATPTRAATARTGTATTAATPRAPSGAAGRNNSHPGRRCRRRYPATPARGAPPTPPLPPCLAAVTSR